MKIAIATSVYAPMINGVAVFSSNLATGLARRGHEVIVLTPSQTGRPHAAEVEGVSVYYLRSLELKVYPDQIHPVPPKKKLLNRELPRVFYKHGFRASVMPQWAVEEILSKFKPDVVHVQGSDPIGVSAVNYAKKSGVPVVLTEHNQPEVLTEPLHLPGVVEKPVNQILNAYFVNRQGRVDYVTMPTQLSIDNLLKGRDLGVPVEAVSNGVDLASFKPGSAPEELYNKYGVPRGVPTILYIGRLDPEKKVGVVIEAFRDFLKKVESLRGGDADSVGGLDSQASLDKHKLDRLSKTLLLVAGDGVDKNHLVSLAEKMGISSNVKFLGRVTGSDLYNIYRMGKVFVTASEIETQGIVLIEAAATGLPLIAVKAGAVAEVCQDGVNGILLPPGDVGGVAGAMLRILSDDKLRREMSEKSLEIAKGHSLEATLDKFEGIYEKLVKKGLKNRADVVE